MYGFLWIDYSYKTVPSYSYLKRQILNLKKKKTTYDSAIKGDKI